MRIRALRVRNVGRFVAPVAVEGLSGGLDILAEGNEFGKSTLFRAIEAVFLLKHTATGKAVEQLRPYGGGEPLIEADFDVGTRRFRIRKQYGRGKGAELHDAAAGRQLARGTEAEDELAQLIGTSGDGKPGRLGLLWVGQGRSLEPAVPDDGERSALQAAIEREIELTSSGDEARLVRARVRAQLEQLAGGRKVTGGHKLPKARSPFEQALRERDRIAAELAETKSAVAVAAERTVQLEAMIAEVEDSYSAEKMAALRERAQRARDALEAARRSRQRVDRAMAEAARASAAEQDDARRLGDFDLRLDLLSKLEAEAARSSAALEECRTSARAAAERLHAAEQAALALTADEERARAALAAHDAAERRREIGDRLARASRTFAAAQKLEGEIAEANARLAANPVTAEAFRDIEAADRDVTRLGDRLAAAAPGVAIELEAGAADRVRVDGKALTRSGSFIAQEPLRIDIAGVGSITVTPGSSADSVTAARQLAAARSRLASMLAQAGAPSVEAAATLRADRAGIETAIEVSRQSLANMAPRGAAALGEEAGELRRQHAQSPEGAALADRAAAAALLDKAQAGRAAAEAELRAARSADQNVRETGVAQQAAADERLRQRAEIEAALPPAAARAAERARLQAAASASAATASEALRVVAALREEALPDARMAELEGELALAEDRLRAATSAAQKLALEMRDLEARLDEAGEAGATKREKELAGALEMASGAVARFEAEKRALQLLDEALARAEGEVRSRFERPVIERLRPYLDLLLPAAEVHLGHGLEAAELVRDGLSEGVERLSDGTREQVAILVRLAFGRLLAESGEPAPLILDDALVYADDQRIGRMFEILGQAAAFHQVLVLTCRSQLFGRLGGNRVTAAPWADAS